MNASPFFSSPARKRPMKLSTTVTLMVCCVTGSMLALVFALWFWQVSNAARDNLQATALAVGRTLANAPEIKRGLTVPTASGSIQSLTQSVIARNDLLFAVVTDMQGVRYSHPNPALIGQRFIGSDLQPALHGKENTAINHGVLGLAMRVFTPVYDSQHKQIGVVVVGIPLSRVDAQINRSRWSVLWTLLFTVVVATLGIWRLVHVLKRVLLGLEPYEITALYKQRQAMLESLKEGVIATDAEGRVTLLNNAARRMLFTDTKDPEHTADNAVLMTLLQEVVRTGVAIPDRELGCNGLLLLSNTVPVRSQGVVIGAISTFRDKTEVSQLLQRLDGMVNYVDALRTTSHEFMNKLHVILGLLSMKSYDKLEEYVLQTAHNYQRDIGAIQHRIKSPVVAGFLLGKINSAKERGFVVTLAEQSQVPDNPNEKQVMVLVTVLGNLIENAFDAMSEQAEGEVSLLLHSMNGWLVCEVSDDGPGIPAAHLPLIFNKGFSTKGDNRGVGLFLASQQLHDLGGTLTVESEPGVFTQFYVHLPWDSERNTA